MSGGDVLLHHHIPSMPVCSKIHPCYPCSDPSSHHAKQPVSAHPQCPLQGMGLIYSVLISNAGPVPAFISLESWDRQSSAFREFSKGRAHQRPESSSWRGAGWPRRKRRMSSDSDPGGAQIILPAGGMEQGRVFQGHRSSPVMDISDGNPSPVLQHTPPGCS